MAEVLVLAEHDSAGEVKRSTLELLTAARRLGEASVVWTGPGAEAAQQRLAEYGAAKVYAAGSADYDDHVVAPKAELLAWLVSQKTPSAVLTASTAEGREVAGRLASRSGREC
jgi:electron transfer flavoprotein alpha subunit